jgi:ferredoxin
MATPEIDTARCTGCGLCVSVCSKDGLVLMESHSVFVGGDECTWCGMCEAVCEHGAISCPYEIVLSERVEPED